jgi:5-methylcytosine-specific restriction endonuclease McrA
MRSFIVSALRAATRRWNPKSQCIKRAWVKRGVYKCESCGTIGAATLPPLKGNKRRRKNIVADHISPIVDPTIGFVDYNTWIDRAFVEQDKLQAICWSCHTEKTNEERAVATERRRREKQ